MIWDSFICTVSLRFYIAYFNVSCRLIVYFILFMLFLLVGVFFYIVYVMHCLAVVINDDNDNKLKFYNNYC